MVTDMRWKVRRSLAYSMHECATILGPELTESDLLPILFHFLQDIADVAEGALMNLPQILRVLKTEQRDQYIESFVDAQNKVEKTNVANWRYRQQLALQIIDFSKLISSAKLDQYYAPKFFELCLDEVAEVRETTATQTTASILHNFYDCPDKTYLTQFVDQMKQFKESNRYNFRQSFVGMVQSILVDFCYVNESEPQNKRTNLIEKIIFQYFQKDLVDLSVDRVVNVRLYLAEAFYRFYKKYEKIELESQNQNLNIRVRAAYLEKKNLIDKYFNTKFFKILQTLKYDSSESVTEFLAQLNVNPNEQLELGSNETGSRRDYSELMGMDPDEKAKINKDIKDATRRGSAFGGLIPDAGFYDVQRV